MLVSAFPQIRLGVIHRLEIYLDCLKAVSKEIVSKEAVRSHPSYGVCLSSPNNNDGGYCRQELTRPVTASSWLEETSARKIPWQSKSVDDKRINLASTN